MRVASLIPLLVSLLAPHVHRAAGHAFVALPPSRGVLGATGQSSAPFEDCVHCLNSGGPTRIMERQKKNLSAREAAALGLPSNDAFPLARLLQLGGAYVSGYGTVLEPESVAKRHGVCGDPGQTRDESDRRYDGRLLDNAPVASFVAGGEIELTVVVAAHHRGHLEVALCVPDGDGSSITQSCFNKQPLRRVSVPGEVSPVDPQYPGRYYLDPPCMRGVTDQFKNGALAALGGNGILPNGQVVSMRYALPDSSVLRECAHCIVQVYWWTANSCNPPGYRSAFFKSIPTQGDCGGESAWWQSTLSACGANAPYPEEFWNCIDISITPKNGSPATPTTTRKPTQAPSGGGSTSVTTKAASQTPTTAAASAPTLRPPRARKWARDYSLGGANQGGSWKHNCACSQVDWDSPFDTQEECLQNWIGTGQCTSATSSVSGATAFTTAPPPAQSAPTSCTTIAASAAKGWAPDWTSGVQSGSAWKPACSCTAVSWPTGWATKNACETAFRTSNGCVASATGGVSGDRITTTAKPSGNAVTTKQTSSGSGASGFFDKDWSLGGENVSGVWKHYCGCKAVTYSTGWSTAATCSSAWQTTGECIFKAGTGATVTTTKKATVTVKSAAPTTTTRKVTTTTKKAVTTTRKVTTTTKKAVTTTRKVTTTTKKAVTTTRKALRYL